MLLQGSGEHEVVPRRAAVESHYHSRFEGQERRYRSLGAGLTRQKPEPRRCLGEETASARDAQERFFLTCNLMCSQT